MYAHILSFHSPVAVEAFTYFLSPSYQVISHLVKVFSPGSVDKPNNENNLKR